MLLSGGEDMNMNRTGLPFLCAVLLAGCGAAPEEATGGSPETDTVRLVPRDTIGIELGDTCYTFGMIGAAEYLSTGNIAVGDVSAMRIRIYSPDGTFLRSGGREGEGPGEFAYPSGAWPAPGGGIAVGDAMGGKVIFYNSFLELDHEVTGFIPSTPQIVSVLGDRAMVGSSFSFDQETMEVVNNLQRWEDGESEASVTYMTRSGVFDQNDPMAIFEDLAINACALPDGRVVAIPLSSEEYMLTCFHPDGEVDWVKEMPFERSRRDEEVIETDRMLMRSTMERYGESGAMVDDIPIPEWSHAVLSLQTDGTRLWARRDGTMIPRYDVFDFDGSLLFHCEVPDLPFAAGVMIRFSPFGALAFEADPADYSRVILLDLPAGSPAAVPEIVDEAALRGGALRYPGELSLASPGLTTWTLSVADDIEPVVVSIYWTAGGDMAEGFGSAHTVNVAPLSGGQGESFPVEDSRFHADLDPAGWFVAEDMNFDGYTDFRLMESPAAGPNTYWLFWLYDPASGGFRRARDWETAGLVSPEFRPDEGVIFCFNSGGYASYSNDWYRVEESLPVLFRRESTELVGDSAITVTLERIDGVMTETARSSSGMEE
jgi:hypothetical protein